MSPERMDLPDLATDRFWDDFATGGYADMIAVDPADVATIRYLCSYEAWPNPSDVFTQRLRDALLGIGSAESAEAVEDDSVDLSFNSPAPAAPLPIAAAPPAVVNSRRWPFLAVAATLVLMLAGLAAWRALDPFGNENSSQAVIPAAVPSVVRTTPGDVVAAPVLPWIDLPVESVPWSAFGVTFDHRSMPPMTESEDANDDSLKLRHLLSGTVSASSDGHLRVLRGSGDGVWEETIPGSPVMLEAGDAIFVDDGAPITLVNSETAPVEFIAWSLFPEGGGNSETPLGWNLYAQNAWHIISLATPDAPVLLRLERVELAPSASLTPPEGALVDQIVYLPRNAAGEAVAPMLGNLPEGGTRNMGRQELTVYRLIIEPLNGEGREGS